MTFLKRMMVLPVNSMFAFVILVVSVLGLMHYGGLTTDALSLVLPMWLLTITQILYALSGLGVVIGIGTARGNIEAAGILLLVAGLLVRSIALVNVIGLDARVVTGLVFNVFFAGAYLVRLRTLIRRETVVLVKPYEAQ